MGRGRLTITAGDDRVEIFVDGERRGARKASLVDLMPGIYRVWVRMPGTGGRQYEIEVRANDDSELEIDWQIDSALTVSEPWTGFVFATEAQRAGEASYASALARRWGSDTIVVVGTMQVQGKPAVVGTMYRANGDVVRCGLVIQDGSDETSLRSLGRFIADGTPAQEVSIIARASDLFAPVRGHSAVAAKLFIASGTAALGASVLLYVFDQDPGHTDSSGNQTHYYRDSTPFSVAAGVVGVAAVGLGIWLWVRDEHATATPTISLAPSHALLGWSGRF